ncbi:hypothetical protein [Streptomyces sp. enrichment culture]|uniref:hypothetical protein n=1 Tax=Streptomyces sp. enrichment culture TaxID=1795815 RepID=UPI003F54D315
MSHHGQFPVFGPIVALYCGRTALACAVRFRAAVRRGPREALPAVAVPAVSYARTLPIDRTAV